MRLRSYRQYTQVYPGDRFFLEQVLETATAILDGWADEQREILLNRLQALFLLRKELDENLDKKSLKQRLFAGAVFNAGHKSPETRVNQAIKNINIMAAVL